MQPPPATLAVTGGTGFVGGHLIRAARAAGYEVRALTRGWRPPEDGIDWVEGALDRPDSLAKLCAGADAVVHVAGLINAPDRAGFEAVNVGGTAAMIDAARARRRPPLRPHLLARRARAGPLRLWLVEGAGPSASSPPPASTGRSSARPPSTAPATARRSNCSGWRGAASSRCRPGAASRSSMSRICAG